MNCCVLKIDSKTSRGLKMESIIVNIEFHCILKLKFGLFTIFALLNSTVISQNVSSKTLETQTVSKRVEIFSMRGFMIALKSLAAFLMLYKHLDAPMRSQFCIKLDIHICYNMKLCRRHLASTICFNGNNPSRKLQIFQQRNQKF